jgi:SOS-response transcriptional repressor LexA
MGKQNNTTTDILIFIKDYIDKNQLSPSYQEIADKFGLKGKSIVGYHIKKLIKQGKIEVGENMKRGIKIKNG